MTHDPKSVFAINNNGDRIIIKGSICTGKTTALRERFLYLVEDLGVPSDSILILLANREQLNDWNAYILDTVCLKPQCHTFSSFIRKELTLFYPLITAASNEIINKDIRPAFLAPDAAILLISKVIQARREKDGIFTSLVSTNERIASVIAGNLSEAALEGIPADEIGCRLYNSLYKKDNDKKRIFEDMDNVLRDYRRKCKELGVFDFGMTVEAYREKLLKDEQYSKALYGKVKHLIVDDLQECSFAELETVGLLLDNVDSAFLAYDSDFGLHEMAHGGSEIIERLILSKCTIISNQFWFGKNDCIRDLSEKLHSAVMTGVIPIPDAYYPLERHPSTELRGEMLEQLGARICSLIDKDGYKPSDIVILSTYADIISELVIGNILKQQGYKLFNAILRQGINDSCMCSSMLVFARLCHPDYGLYPEKDKVKLLLEMLFGFNPVNSAKIARKTCNTFPFPQLPDVVELDDFVDYKPDEMAAYTYCLDWISSYKRRGRPMDIGSFFQSALVELFLIGKYAAEDIEKARMLVESADTYCRTTSMFNRNSNKDFIEMAEKLTKASDANVSIGGIYDGESVVFTTPAEYITNPSMKKILVICSLSSRNWAPGRAKELTNHRVLSASWNKDVVYSPAEEELDGRRYLAAMMRTLVRKCSERIITFESQLSENGYENDGVLAEIFDGLLT